MLYGYFDGKIKRVRKVTPEFTINASSVGKATKLLKKVVSENNLSKGYSKLALVPVTIDLSGLYASFINELESFDTCSDEAFAFVFKYRSKNTLGITVDTKCNILHVDIPVIGYHYAPVKPGHWDRWYAK